MSIINTNAKEIHCKILYYGPERSGKKSSIFYIQSKFAEPKREFWVLPFKKKMYCLVLFIGKVFGFQIFFHIYNLNNESKEDNRNLLNGVDGILFVANSDPKDKQQNIVSFSEMERFLSEKGEDIFKLPLVLQYNKRDLKNTMSVKELRIDLNKYNSRDFTSSALEGRVILEPLKHLCKLTLNNLKRADF